jgi:hypothetical protein
VLNQPRGAREASQVLSPGIRRGLSAHVIERRQHRIHVRLRTRSQGGGFGLREAFRVPERLVNVTKGRPRRRVNAPQRFHDRWMAGVGGILDQHLRVAEDLVDRRTKVVP